MTTSFLDKYPRAKQAMIETGMSLDQLYIWTGCELEKIGRESK